jgi:hypothetical protein
MVTLIFVAIISGVAKLYGTSSDRIRSPSISMDPVKARLDKGKEYASRQYKLARSREMSPTYVQSRRFHPDQFIRDNRDLGQSFSLQSPISGSSHYYGHGSFGMNHAISSQEACRLTNSYCAGDYQCCSGKCRCVRWSVMGKMSCWKKCF